LYSDKKLFNYLAFIKNSGKQKINTFDISDIMDKKTIIDKLKLNSFTTKLIVFFSFFIGFVELSLISYIIKEYMKYTSTFNYNFDNIAYAFLFMLIIFFIFLIPLSFYNKKLLAIAEFKEKEWLDHFDMRFYELDNDLNSITVTKKLIEDINLNDFFSKHTEEEVRNVIQNKLKIIFK